MRYHKLFVPEKYQKTLFELAKDPRVSLKGKGLYLTLLTLPNGSDFSARKLAKDIKDCKDGILAGIRDLEFFDYLTKKLAPGEENKTIRRYHYFLKGDE